MLIVSLTKLMVAAVISGLNFIRRGLFIESKDDEQCSNATVFIIHTLVIYTLWQNL
jgi:hypothetical protein